MLEQDRTEKRKKRHSTTQEDFTPLVVVDLMVNKLSEEVFTDFTKKVLDNSCGVGYLLIGILRKRLQYCNTPERAILAVKTLFGVELMADNVKECRENLYNCIIEKFPQIVDDYELNFRLRAIIRNRIQWNNSLIFDYDKWPTLSGRPRAKHLNVNFTEFKRPGDIKYPQWHQEQDKEVSVQLSLF
jgi:hypothetical protein